MIVNAANTFIQSLKVEQIEKLLNRQLLLLHEKECKIYQDKLKKRIKYIIHNTLYKVYYNIRNKENKQQRGKKNEIKRYRKTNHVRKRHNQ